MASLWDTLRYGGRPDVYQQNIGLPCLLLAGLLATACALDTRTLHESPDSNHPSLSGDGGEAGSMGGSANVNVHPPEPIDVPICSYSNDTVEPGCQTLAKNAGFTKDTDGWQQEPYSVKIEWAQGDAGGSSVSGSISVTNSLGGTVDGIAPGAGMQCLPVEPGATYVMAGDVYIPEGQGAGLMGPYVGRAGLSILFWTAKNCSDTSQTLGTSFQTNLVDNTGQWTHVLGSAIAPEGVQSMSIRVLTIKAFKEDSFKALFDNVLLQQR